MSVYYGSVRKNGCSASVAVHGSGRGSIGVVLGPPGAAASALLLDLSPEELRTFALRCLAAAEVLEEVQR